MPLGATSDKEAMEEDGGLYPVEPSALSPSPEIAMASWIEGISITARNRGSEHETIRVDGVVIINLPVTLMITVVCTWQKRLL